ncbi:MAG: hypothetical protein JWQ57_2611 [Mucilaginibacter sp.]|nr:hypothetical protein [Mucilaginibacter sp.]
MVGFMPAFAQHKKVVTQYFPYDYQDKTALDTLFHDWYAMY